MARNPGTHLYGLKATHLYGLGHHVGAMFSPALIALIAMLFVAAVVAGLAIRRRALAAR